jgi:DNA-binding response OmpR family regulator
MDRPAPAERVGSRRQQVSRPLEHLTPQERAVYLVLAQRPGRVLSRAEIAREAGLEQLSERRCDSLLVGVRRAVGVDAVRTVRRRGWMLVP